MTKIDTYSAKGIKQQATSLPKGFIEKENSALLAQAIRVYEARRHPGLSKVKTRGEVVASKRKIYRQKGTGRARHGALSAPIFVGGGKAHGPKGLKRKLELSKKMGQKAVGVSLGAKVKEGKLVVVSGLSSLKKTKEVQKLVDKLLGKEKKTGKVTFVLSKENLSGVKAIRNIPNAKAVLFDNLNAYKVFYGGVIALDKEALAPAAKKTKTTTTKTRKAEK